MSKTAIWVAALLALLAVAAKGKKQDFKKRMMVKYPNFTLNLKHILLPNSYLPKKYSLCYGLKFPTLPSYLKVQSQHGMARHGIPPIQSKNQNSLKSPFQSHSYGILQ